MFDRAYALLEVKAFDSGQRTITGLASTPTPDRKGDILEPLGATFCNPLPLLLHHDRERPVGEAALTATRDGIAFTATFPPDDKLPPGAVRDRVHEALHSVQAGLIRGVSIGFRPLADGVKMLKSGGLHLLRTEICELSLVTVPANVETTIRTIKSYDLPHLAASGPTPPGVSGRPRLRVESATMTPTTAEQITRWENKRASLAARMNELMSKSADATLDAEASEEYDGLELDVKAADQHLTRLRALEKTQIAAAAPVDLSTNGAPNYRPVARPTSISVKPNVPPGTSFVRYTLAMLNAKGDSFRALEYAKQWKDSTPDVELMVKAAVAPGSTTDPAWAGALVTVSNLTNEFIELSRPATLLGRIPGLKPVPFNVSMPIQTAGGTYRWVGQGKAKPVGTLQFSSTSLGPAKVAGIIVLTEELVKSSSPSAEAIVREDMVAGIARYLDEQFTDPAVAEVPGVSPASITNGAATAASADNPGTDLGTIVTYFSGNGVPLNGLVILMNETNAFAMGYKRDAFGQIIFPGVGPSGGSANGISIITSSVVGDKVIGLQPNRILFADEGGVQIDVSREASLQMNDAPVNPADPATTVFTSLWQDNLVGLRAERFINWKKAQPTSVYYLTGAVYTF